jgi:hypothetical protein
MDVTSAIADAAILDYVRSRRVGQVLDVSK